MDRKVIDKSDVKESNNSKSSKDMTKNVSKTSKRRTAHKDLTQNRKILPLHFLIIPFIFIFIGMCYNNHRFHHLPEVFRNDTLSYLKEICYFAPPKKENIFSSSSGDETIKEDDGRSFSPSKSSIVHSKYRHRVVGSFEDTWTLQYIASIVNSGRFNRKKDELHDLFPKHDIYEMIQSKEDYEHYWGKRNSLFVHHNLTNYMVLIRTKDEYLHPSQRRKGVVVVSSHYDSALFGPGCFDDGINVAVMLKAIESVYDLSSMVFYHDILFLFNDGEEMGLLGGHMFISSDYLLDFYKRKQLSYPFDHLHPRKEEIPIIFMNLESGGVNGKPFILRSSNEWILKILKPYLKIPLGNFIFRDIFESGLMGSDTDYSVYHQPDQHIYGFDFLVFEDGHYYHTSQDSFDKVSIQSAMAIGRSLFDFIMAFATLKQDFPHNSSTFQQQQKEEEYYKGIDQSPLYMDLFQETLIVFNFDDLRNCYFIVFIIVLTYLIVSSLFNLVKKKQIVLFKWILDILLYVAVFIGSILMNYVCSVIISFLFPLFQYSIQNELGLLITLFQNILIIFICLYLISIVFYRKSTTTTAFQFDSFSIILFHCFVLLLSLKYEIGSTLLSFFIISFLMIGIVLQKVVFFILPSSSYRSYYSLFIYMIVVIIPSIYFFYLIHIGYLAMIGISGRLRFKLSSMILNWDIFVSCYCFIQIYFFYFTFLFSYFDVIQYIKKYKKVVILYGCSSFLFFFGFLTVFLFCFSSSSISSSISSSFSSSFSSLGEERKKIEWNRWKKADSNKFFSPHKTRTSTKAPSKRPKDTGHKQGQSTQQKKRGKFFTHTSSQEQEEQQQQQETLSKAFTRGSGRTRLKDFFTTRSTHFFFFETTLSSEQHSQEGWKKGSTRLRE